MQGDFSRLTFDPLKHFSSVLVQQGRVQLDADLNEQAAILLRQLRTVVSDLLGVPGAPARDHGFDIEPNGTKTVFEDFTISAGRAYVDGILVENDTQATYWTQPDLVLDPQENPLPQQGSYLVYLRVWERLITALQDPDIREVALGDPGPDTCARARTVWQVATTTAIRSAEEFPSLVTKFTPTGLLKARAKQPPATSDDPCVLPPDSRYRGPENQLYRIEVHTGGPAWPTRSIKNLAAGTLTGATFKWSRENASVVFPIVSLTGAVAKVTTLGRDGKLNLEVGDRVEIVDDTIAGHVADDAVLTEPQPAAPRLRQVVAIDAADLLVTLDQQPGDEDCGLGANPFLRRWDHLPVLPATQATPSPVAVFSAGLPPDLASDGALPLLEGRWLDIEDGVQVFFGPPKDATDAGTYRRGDYWLVPARTAIGDVLWPADVDGPVARGPHGVRYHYAALATAADTGINQLLKVFNPLA